MYDDMISIRRFKRKIDDIEKEVNFYARNGENMYLPDCISFYDYAYEHYIPKQDNTIVQSKYKALLGKFNVSDIPGYLYCLVLLAHLYKQATLFIEEHKENFNSLERALKNDFNILYCKVKLLIGFWKKIEGLVAVFINSMDMVDVEYLDDDIKTFDSRAIKHPL